MLGSGFLGARSRPQRAAWWPVPVRVAARASDGSALDLILGLHWEAILGRDLTREARRRARQRGATHWSHAGGRAEVVGMTRLDAAPRPPWRTPCAAAQGFARLAGPGVHLAAMPLPEDLGGFWLAVVRDGQVLTGGDRVLAGDDECAQAWHTWHERFGDTLTLWGDGSPCGTAELRPLNWATLAAHVGPTAILHASRGGLGTPRAAAPRLAAFALASVFPLAALWWWWQLDSAPTTPAAAVGESLPGPEVWREALANWYRDTSLPTVQTLQQLVIGVLQVPASLRGWDVQRVSCQRTERSRWQCSAAYRRATPGARQEGLVAALPDAWHVQWRDLDHFDASWSFVGAERSVSPAQLQPDPERWFTDADRLLRWRPAWQRLEVGAVESIALRPRLADGQPAPPVPRGWHPPSRRSLLLYGPLRSLSVLDEALTRRIAWHALDIQFGDEPRPDLVRSALMLTLQGVLYESASSGPEPV